MEFEKTPGGFTVKGHVGFRVGFRYVTGNTSQIAAEEVDALRDRQLALMILAEYGPITQADLDDLSGRGCQSVSKRLSELQRPEEVKLADDTGGRVIGRNGKLVNRWVITPLGREIYNHMLSGPTE